MNPLMISGYASVFGEVDMHDEIVQSGSFLNSITRINPDIDFHLEHGPVSTNKWRQKFGKYNVGDITVLHEDAHGLFITVKIHSLYVKRIKQMIETKIINGFSIGHLTLESHVDKNGYRNLDIIDLHEVSLVRKPSCAGAIITNPGFKMKVYETSLSIPGINLLSA